MSSTLNNNQIAFRIMDLPAEIRKQIYRNTLAVNLDCITYSNFRDLKVDTALLQVSRTVYREAYEVLIKSYCFIRVRAWDFETQPWDILRGKTYISGNFKGYMLHIDINKTPENEQRPPKYDKMLFGSAWHRFCRDNARRAEGMDICLIADPCSLRTEGGLKPAIADTFIQKTLGTMFSSFAEHMKSVKSLVIEGPVDQGLLEAFNSQMAQEAHHDEWGDCDHCDTCLSDEWW